MYMGKIKTFALGLIFLALVGVSLADYSIYNKAVYIKTSGEVGMGTVNPATKLEVIGTITATSATLSTLTVNGSIGATSFTGNGSGLTGITSTASPSANSIQAGMMATGSVTGGAIATNTSITIIGSLSAGSIGVGSITTSGSSAAATYSGRLVSNMVTTSDITAGSITRIKVSEHAIATTELQDGSVAGYHMQRQAVGTAEAANGHINSFHFASNVSVNSTGIATFGAVTSTGSLDALNDVVLSSEARIVRKMINNDSTALAVGDVVALCTVDATSLGRSVIKTSAAASPVVFGVSMSNTGVGEIARICTSGMVDTIKVNGATAIATGDPLSTYSSKGIAAKGTYGTGAIIGLAFDSYASSTGFGKIRAWIY